MFPTISRALRYADPLPQTSAKQNALEKEALWLIDTLVLTTIHSETIYTNVNTCQRSEQRIKSESTGYPSYRWTYLHPIRLEPLPSDDEKFVIPYQESKVGPLSNC